MIVSGLYLEHNASEVSNVSLTVLSGEVVLELWPGNASLTSNTSLSVDESSPIPLHVVHRVHTTSNEPACYMYTYTRKSAHDEQAKFDAMDASVDDVADAEPGPATKTFRGRIKQRLKNLERAVGFVSNAFLHLMYSVPMATRVRLR